MLKDNQRLIVQLVVILLLPGLLYSSEAANAMSCIYRFYPTMAPFEEDQITTPNSICIFPDGRSTLNDAVLGSVEIIYYWLQVEETPGVWSNTLYGGESLFMGGNVQICETGPFMYADLTNMPAMFFQQSIYGGGHSAVDGSGQPISGAVVYWAPASCGEVPVDLYFNSPDIDGDLEVGISDLSDFSSDYYGGVYNYRSDFDFNGVVGLNDLAIFSSAYGASCP